MKEDRISLKDGDLLNYLWLIVFKLSVCMLVSMLYLLL